jgi:hypothetical protein
MPHHSLKTLINSLALPVGTLIFNSSYHSQSKMVTTCSHPQPDVQAGIAGTSNDQNARFKEFMRCMTDSMEVLKKHNEDLTSRFSAREGCDGQRD